MICESQSEGFRTSAIVMLSLMTHFPTLFWIILRFFNLNTQSCKPTLGVQGQINGMMCYRDNIGNLPVIFNVYLC